MTRVLLGTWQFAEAGTPSRPLRPNEIVDDVEALVWGVIARAPTARSLSEADREELFGGLLERVVILTRKYDAGRDDPSQRRALAFRPWLYERLRLGAIDELRAWRQRCRIERQRSGDG